MRLPSWKTTEAVVPLLARLTPAFGGWGLRVGLGWGVGVSCEALWFWVNDRRRAERALAATNLHRAASIQSQRQCRCQGTANKCNLNAPHSRQQGSKPGAQCAARTHPCEALLRLPKHLCHQDLHGALGGGCGGRLACSGVALQRGGGRAVGWWVGGSWCLGGSIKGRGKRGSAPPCPTPAASHSLQRDEKRRATTTRPAPMTSLHAPPPPHPQLQAQGRDKLQTFTETSCRLSHHIDAADPV